MKTNPCRKLHSRFVLTKTIERIGQMGTSLALSLAIVFFAISSSIASESADQLIEKAHQVSRAGNVDSAIVIVEQVINRYPNHAAAWASLGIFKGMKAGKATDYTEAGRLSFEAFSHLDKAVELDPTSVKARLWRGILGVKVPEFMGRLEQAVADLEFVVGKFEGNPDHRNRESAIQALDLLIQAYRSKGLMEKALDCAKRMERISEDSQMKQRAQSIQEELKREISKAGREPSREHLAASSDSLLADALKLTNAGRLREAEEILKKTISVDNRNVRAYKELAKVIMLQMQQGIYDERIRNDTNLAANRAFEIMRVLDEALAIAPDDLELRLMRGMMGIELPFFVNRIDQGIEDLEMVVAQDAPPDIKSMAEFYLGYGYQKKGMKYWRNLINQYPDSRIAEMAFEAISPPIRKVDLSKVERPAVVIDFVIAFKDELPPQIALWIETDKGEYVKTVYVSGFSGFAKDAQIVLPIWAKKSNFIDADATTSASIDLGEHYYVWNLLDHKGEKISQGNYVIKLEVNFWPSGKYEYLRIPISIGKKDESAATREGKLVPYLEVKYLQ